MPEKLKEMAFSETHIVNQKYITSKTVFMHVYYPSVSPKYFIPAHVNEELFIYQQHDLG
jgi:hypothetical protein